MAKVFFIEIPNCEVRVVKIELQLPIIALKEGNRGYLKGPHKYAAPFECTYLLYGMWERSILSDHYEVPRNSFPCQPRFLPHQIFPSA
jgi:hypothetical protein